MLLEDFACELHRPLTALKFINEVLEEKIEEDWNFFHDKTRKEAEYLIKFMNKLNSEKHLSGSA